MTNIKFALIALAFIGLVVASPAEAASTFSNTQSSQRWMAVDPHTSWDRQLFAIGPHEWTVSYKKNGNDYATEEWKAPEIFTCHKNPLDCRPSGVNNGNGRRYSQWFWGHGWEVNRGGMTVSDYVTISASDNELYQVNNNCFRGIGSAIAWLSGGDCRGTHAYYATGPYGWAYGQLDRNYERDGAQQVGMQMPIHWEVRGFLSSTPPPAQPAN